MSIDRFYKQKAFIQRAVDVSDDAGYKVSSWQTVYIIKGCLDMVSGNSSYMAHSEQTQYTHIFICRPFSLLVTPKDRVVIGNSVFDIVFIDDPVRMKHHTEIQLKYNSLLNVNAEGEQEELTFHRLFTESTYTTGINTPVEL